jgi:cysteine synthase
MGYVGNTPLIRLRRLSELTDCDILGKAEFMNRLPDRRSALSGLLYRRRLGVMSLVRV